MTGYHLDVNPALLKPCPCGARVGECCFPGGMYGRRIRVGSGALDGYVHRARLEGRKWEEPAPGAGGRRLPRS